MVQRRLYREIDPELMVFWQSTICCEAEVRTCKSDLPCELTWS